MADDPWQGATWGNLAVDRTPLDPRWAGANTLAVRKLARRETDRTAPGKQWQGAKAPTTMRDSPAAAKARENPSLTDYGNVGLTALQGAPQGAWDFATKAIPSLAVRGYNYLRDSTPGQVMSDVGDLASQGLHYASRNPVGAAASLAPITGDVMSVGSAFDEAARARHAGNIAQSDAMARYIAPMAMLGLIPEVGPAASGAIKGALRGGEEAAGHEAASLAARDAASQAVGDVAAPAAADVAAPSLAVKSKAQLAREAKAAKELEAQRQEAKRVRYGKTSPIVSGLEVRPGEAPSDLAVHGPDLPGVEPSPYDPLPPPPLLGADNPLLVSTRQPSAANYAREGDPSRQMLWQNADALMRNPEAFAKNMRQLQQEPFMAGASGLRDPYKIHDYALDQGSKNLQFIVNDLMDPNKVAAAREWYPVAHGFSNRAADRNELPRVAGYGVQAVFSPQTPWDINVGRTDRMMDMWGDRFSMDPAEAERYIRAQQEAIKNPKNWDAITARGPDYARRIAEMDPEEITNKFDRFARVALADQQRNDPAVPRVLLSGQYGNDPYANITWGSGDVVNKAWNILQDPTLETVRQQLLGGGKVPTFYNNIAAPYSRLPLSTIDTHSAGAFSLYPGGGNDPIVYRAMGLGDPVTGRAGNPRYQAAAKPDSTGAKGLYGVISDAHDLAAQRLGFNHPREVQSATWEGVRDLWGQEGKTDDLKNAISNAWTSNPGNPDQARYDIADLLGQPVPRVYAVP